MTSQINMPAANHQSRHLDRDTSDFDDTDTSHVEQIVVPAVAAILEFHQAPHFRISTRTTPPSGSVVSNFTNPEPSPLDQVPITLDDAVSKSDELQLEQHQHHASEDTDSSPTELASESVPDRGSWAKERVPDKSLPYAHSHGAEDRQSRERIRGRSEFSDTIPTTDEVRRLNGFDLMVMKTMNASISINKTEVLLTVPSMTLHRGQLDRSARLSEPEEDTMDSDLDREDIWNENEADDSMTSSPQIEYEMVEGNNEYNYYIVYDAVGDDSVSATDGNYYYHSPRARETG